MIISFLGDIKIDSPSRIIMDPTLAEELDKSAVNQANLEAPIKGVNSKGIMKSGPQLFHQRGIIDLLLKNKISLLSLANNHMMDYGEESLTFTKEIIEQQKGIAIGAGLWNEAYQVRFIETNGLKIGFLAVTQHEFGVLDEEQKGKSQVGTAWMLHPCIDELIVKGRKQCDYLFVLPHAGIENEYYPLPELRTLYRHWINMGADGVFASHPHTPQGWEMYNNKPICYSLGNFCFENHSKSLPPYWNYGLMAQVSLQEGRVEASIKYVRYDQENHQLSLTEEDGFCRHINEINSNLHDAEQYVNEVNTYCDRLADYYDLAFAKGGYYKYTTKKFSVQLVKQIIGKRYKGNLNHALNNIRCEAHRWAIIRAWNNKIKKGDVSI
jgi:poly-gamma-glutamate synthesis protein (capsule biosynthesis protein)